MHTRVNCRSDFSTAAKMFRSYQLLTFLSSLNLLLLVYNLPCFKYRVEEREREIIKPLEQFHLTPRRDFVQRGDFWVGYNRVPAADAFAGNESITLTTPSDHTNLDNLVQLVSTWQGPISCAVFAPGGDYQEALQVVKYLRECTTPLIRKLVSFHFLFPKNHIPRNAQKQTTEWLNATPINCSKKPEFGDQMKTHRKKHGILFPINVARNVAREMATTHFVFPSDIELYPSPGLIPRFLQMIQYENEPKLRGSNPMVFALPVFEVEKNVTELPQTRKELNSLLNSKMAIPFHETICKECHNIPRIEKWVQARGSTKFGIFETLRRQGAQRYWEPFYIGMKMEPVFDERVTWEGRSNKRIQAFAMCLLGYNFHVLNDAFLVHRPGIKLEAHFNVTIREKMDKEIASTIVPELKRLYGSRPGCTV